MKPSNCSLSSYLDNFSYYGPDGHVYPKNVVEVRCRHHLIVESFLLGPTEVPYLSRLGMSYWEVKLGLISLIHCRYEEASIEPHLVSLHIPKSNMRCSIDMLREHHSHCMGIEDLVGLPLLTRAPAGLKLNVLDMIPLLIVHGR